MTTWKTVEAFKASIDINQFAEGIQYVHGVVARVDESLFERPHEEINEPQYLHQAWRWQGIHAGIPFYLDVAASEIRRVKPLNFYLYHSELLPVCWQIVPRMHDVFQAIGQVRIDHVTSQARADSQFALFREAEDWLGWQSTRTLYRCDEQSEGEQFAKYLQNTFDDQAIYLGRRVS